MHQHNSWLDQRTTGGVEPLVMALKLKSGISWQLKTALPKLKIV